MSRKLYDVSMPIDEGVQVYKNKDEKRPKFEVTSDFTTGSAHETRVHMDVHTGTHVDAPLHMVPGGQTIESVTLEQLVRPCKVVDLTHVTDAIHASDLEGLDIANGDFVLFHTKNSHSDAFDFEFVYVAEDAAAWLADKKVTGVGVDGLGVERGQSEHPTHKLLFECGAVIIEGLRLADVPAGSYFMVAAPLRLLGIDAAPARVILFEQAL